MHVLSVQRGVAWRTTAKTLHKTTSYFLEPRQRLFGLYLKQLILFHDRLLLLLGHEVTCIVEYISYGNVLVIQARGHIYLSSIVINGWIV